MGDHTRTLRGLPRLDDGSSGRCRSDPVLAQGRCAADAPSLALGEGAVARGQRALRDRHRGPHCAPHPEDQRRQGASGDPGRARRGSGRRCAASSCAVVTGTQKQCLVAKALVFSAARRGFVHLPKEDFNPNQRLPSDEELRGIEAWTGTFVKFAGMPDEGLCVVVTPRAVAADGAEAPGCNVEGATAMLRDLLWPPGAVGRLPLAVETKLQRCTCRPQPKAGRASKILSDKAHKREDVRRMLGGASEEQGQRRPSPRRPEGHGAERTRRRDLAARSPAARAAETGASAVALKGTAEGGSKDAQAGAAGSSVV